MDSLKWKKIKEVFSAVIELPLPERRAVLDKTETEIRLEVEKLLLGHNRSEPFLENPFLVQQGFVDGDARDKYIGEKIGNYLVVEKIGTGGMGAVYLAERNDEQFRQKVALKIIKRGMDWDEIIRRFRRERQVLAALNHPYIARLLDGGTTDEGLPFFVMECVEGIPVTKFCDERKLDIKERLRLFQKICSAVSYIHQNLIVHRDIKPSNILVCADATPKLLDFGIAKLLMSEDSFTIEQTATGVQQPFTPQYASPEQIHGERVTTASDIYSLGVLLYELLCGHHPLRLKNRPSHEILKIVSEQEPTAPSTAAVTKEEIARDDNTKEILLPETIAGLRRANPERLRQYLRGDLDNITLKALRKNPAERYQSAEDISEDIRRHLEKLPVTARPATVAYRAAKFVRRNRATSVFVITLVLLIVAVGGSWAYFFWRLQNENAAAQTAPTKAAPRAIAALPFKFVGGESGDESLGADLTDTLIARLGRIQELEIRPSSAVAPFAGKDPLSAGKELRVETVLESSVEKAGERVKISSRLLRTEDGQVLWSGTFDENFADIFNVQDEIAERVAAALLGHLTVEQRRKVQKHYTDNPEAYKLYLKGKYLRDQQTEESFKRSIQFFNQAIQLDPGYALAYSGIADVYGGLTAIYLAPGEAMPKAKAATMRALELDPDLADARVMLALILEVYDWNFAAAEVEYKRAIEINPSHAGARHWYGRFLALCGRQEESAAQFKRAAELDPLSPFIALDSNFVYFNRREYDRAIEQINKSIELNDSFWFAYWVRGWAYQGKGDLAAAVADYQKAYSIGNSPVPYAFLANAYAVSGKKSEARKILDELLELRKKQYVGAPAIAAVYAGLGDEERTFEWLEKGFEERNDLIIWIKFDHRFDNLRSDARFQDLLRRVGLPD